MSTDRQQPAPQKERTFFYSLCRALAAFLGATFFPVRYHHKENLTAQAPYILIANHQSWMDPLTLAVLCKDTQIRFVGKKELTKSKFGAWALDQLHMITVDRHNSDLAAMRQCMRALRDGRVLGIFPEGTRHLPDLMSQVETGTAVLALRAKVPLQPVYIDSKRRFLRVCHAYVGQPMDISDLSAQGFDSGVVDQLTARIRDTFLSMRDETQAEKKQA